MPAQYWKVSQIVRKYYGRLEFGMTFRGLPGGGDIQDDQGS